MTQPQTASIVLCSYNGERYIEEQLRSLLDQTVLPQKLILRDDGSSDRTLQIAERILKSASFDVDIRQNEERLGFRDNFLRAALESTTDYVCFCDQDDIWRPTKLAQCAAYFGRPEISIISHQARLVDETGKDVGYFRQGIKHTRVRPPLSYDPWFTFWGFSMVFRRDLLSLADARSRFIDFIAPTHKIAHDRWIMFLGQMVGASVEIADVLVDYRQHNANLYGVGAKRSSFSRRMIRDRSKTYLSATAEMLDSISNMPKWTSEKFPLFDKAASLKFFGRAFDQLQARDDIYNARSTRHAIALLGKSFLTGKYMAVHDNSIRFSSIARDLNYVVSDMLQAS